MPGDTNYHKLRSLRRRPAFDDPVDALYGERRVLASQLIEHGISALPEGLLAQLTGVATAAPSYIELTYEPPPSLPRLPDRYGFKGGAARFLVEHRLGLLGADAAAPRDLDLIRLGTATEPEDNRVARAFNPEDYARGHGIELVKSWDEYLRRRDLSVNEVGSRGTSLVLSYACLLDTWARVLRPCRYRSGSLHRSPQLLSSTAVKMVRLYAERRVQGESWLVAGIPADQVVREFDIALQLRKALQQGHAVAEEFLLALSELGWISIAEILETPEVDLVQGAVEHFSPLLSFDER